MTDPTDTADTTAAESRSTGNGVGTGADTGTGNGVNTCVNTGASATLLPRDECDKLEQHLQNAVVGFVDRPRAAVEEADRVLEEILARFTDEMSRRRRTLRLSWQGGDGTDPDQPGTASTDTEQLRLALRDYRELADQLLHR